MEKIQGLKQKIDSAAGGSFVGEFMKEQARTGKPYDDQFLQDLVLNFLIAGRDTTAESLSWTFFLLRTHPHVEKRVREESGNLIGNRELTYADLNQFSFLLAVVNESLRLYPSAPLDHKVSVSEDILPDGSKIDKGDVVVYNIFAMGRSKDIWGDDADEFKPERWLNKYAPSSYSYPVFNAGPRECSGKRLAVLNFLIAGRGTTAQSLS